MNEAAGTETSAEVKRWLDTWKSSLQDVLSQVAGKTIALATSEEHLPTLPDDVCYTVISVGAAAGEMSLRLPSASGSILAQMLLAEAQPAAGELTPERREALDELLRQIAGQAATALTSPAGQVQLQVASSAASTWAPAVSASYRTASETEAQFAIELQLSSALLNALSPA